MATSEKKLYSFKELRENFAKAFPSVAEQVKHYRRVNEYDLLIILYGRKKILYDGFNHSYIELPKDRNKMTKEEYRNEFAYRLKCFMERENLRQKDLVEMTGITRSTISTYVRAVRLPGIDHVYKIAYALHCSVEDFRYY